MPAVAQRDRERKPDIAEPDDADPRMVAEFWCDVLGYEIAGALWFDGISEGLPPAEACPLCDLQPNACSGILTHGTTLTIAPRPTAPASSIVT